MRVLAFIVLIVTFTIVPAEGQKKRSPSGNRIIASKPLINSELPSVYISFTKRETIDSDLFLFFKLTNNMYLPIVLDMSGVGDKRLGDTSLYYVIEDSKTGEELVGSLFCHVCSFNSLPSGKSILFAVPAKEIKRGNRMRIRYEFEWETMISDYEGSSTLHTVAFDLLTLPASSN